MGLTHRKFFKKEKKMGFGSSLVATMRDPELVLELVSRSSDSGEWNKHSLCPFCKHRGQDSCPNIGIQKSGICNTYDFKEEPAPQVEDQILSYLGAKKPETHFLTVSSQP